METRKFYTFVSVLTICIFSLFLGCSVELDNDKETNPVKQSNTDEGTIPITPDNPVTEPTEENPPTKTYTVTFMNDDNIFRTFTKVNSGSKIYNSLEPSKNGYNFEGWYKEESCINLWDFYNDIVTSDITLYAKWGPPIIVSGTTLAEKLQWLDLNVKSNSSYILEVTAGYEEIAPQNLSYYSRNVTIQIIGIGSVERVIIGSFKLGNGVTLILDDKITLLGGEDGFLVRVNSGSTFIMNTGSKIISNMTYNRSDTLSFRSGGVYVAENGQFILNGGIIEGSLHSDYIMELLYESVVVNNYGTFIINNGTILKGDGIYIQKGNFTMNNGNIERVSVISGSFNLLDGTVNRVSVETRGTFIMDDGDVSSVYLRGGDFTMNNGNISNGDWGVTIGDNGGYFTMNGGFIENNRFGGVSGSYGTFIMRGGTISNNTHVSGAAGVSLTKQANFIMEGGTISNNTSTIVVNGSTNYGGGVRVDGKFTMNGGIIKNNSIIKTETYTGTAYGGGVYVKGTFIMNDGIISNNSTNGSTNYGSGIYVDGTLTIKGGVIEENNGDGIYFTGTTLTMDGGLIRGNAGRGIQMVSGSFLMRAGTITGNNGGISWSSKQNFDKSGGIIYGYSEGDHNSNVVRNSSGIIQNEKGHAILLVSGNITKRKETHSSLLDNLSFIGTLNPPILDGEWDY